MKPIQTTLLLASTLFLGACAGTSGGASEAYAAEAPAPAPEAAPDATPTALDILARSVEASNAKAMVAETDSARMTGSITLEGMGLTGDLEIHAMKPNKFLMSSTMGAAGTTVVGYDGEVGWMKNPMTGTMLLDGPELFALQMQADYEAALMSPEKYETIELLGREEMEGADCYKLRLVYKAPADAELAEETLKTRTSTHWFDVESGLQVAMESTQQQMQSEVTILTVFEEYREVAGYLTPVVSKQKMMGVEVVTRIDELEANAVEASLFDLPDDIKALLAD